MNQIAHLIIKSSPERGGGSLRLTEGAGWAGLFRRRIVLALTGPSTASRRFPTPFRGGISL
jgi:hypothetical protein